MGESELPRSDGAWEVVGGWSGHYRHTGHPEWQVHVADSPQRRFMLRNALTGAERDLGDAAATGGLYLALDIGHAAITSGVVLDLPERLGQLGDGEAVPDRCLVLELDHGGGAPVAVLACQSDREPFDRARHTLLAAFTTCPACCAVQAARAAVIDAGSDADT